MIDVEGAQEGSQYLNSNIPLTSIKTITLAPPAVVSSLGMMCMIGTSTFLGSADDGFLNNTTATVIQSTHPIMTDLLRSFGPQLPNYVLWSFGNSSSWPFNSSLALRLSAAGIDDTPAEFSNKHLRILSSDELQAATISIETTASGEKIRSISNHFNFPIESSKPRHLAYFSFSFRHNQPGGRETPVKNDIVFNNSVLSSTTYLYLTPAGKYWMGPVVRDGSEYKTPLDTEPEQMILQLKKIRNIKLQ